VRVADGEVELIRPSRGSAGIRTAAATAADRRRFQQRLLPRLRLDRPLYESRHRQVIVLAEHAERADYVGRNYHIDPHPRFCCNDQYVVFTTTVRTRSTLRLFL
jgi:hypothetical protein